MSTIIKKQINHRLIFFPIKTKNWSNYLIHDNQNPIEIALKLTAKSDHLIIIIKNLIFTLTSFDSIICMYIIVYNIYVYIESVIMSLYIF